MSRMRVLCLIQGVKSPSARVRVLNLLPELQAEGIDAQALAYPRTRIDKLRVFATLSRFDVVLLQKRLVSPFDLRLLRLLSKKLVFDFDDAIYYRHDSHAELLSAGRQRKFRGIVRAADLVIAGNDILAAAARQFSNRAVVLPSAVEVRDVPCRQHGTADAPVRIGWIGGVNNLIHLQSLSGVLRRLARDYAIELRVISGRELTMPGVSVRFVPWSLETQERELAALDIGIMPLPNNPHTEGKCAYKALQYMAAGVPPVVSDVGTNRSVVIDGESGFVAATDEDFYRALELLITDGPLRAQLGAQARARAEENYSVQVVGKALGRELHRLRDRRCG